MRFKERLSGAVGAGSDISRGFGVVFLFFRIFAPVKINKLNDISL